MRSAAALGAVLAAVDASSRMLGCAHLNYCSGHGQCARVSPRSPMQTCICDEGWGNPADVAIDRGLDCSLRESRARAGAR